MVICLERGAGLHMAQLMPLSLTISRSSKIQIGFTFMVPAHLGSPEQSTERVVRNQFAAVKGSCTWLDTLEPQQQFPGGQRFRQATVTVQNSRWRPRWHPH